MPRKFGVGPQSFCQNQNPVQNQDQDQYQDFDTTHQIVFGSANSFESYCVYSQESTFQTDGQKIFFACFGF